MYIVASLCVILVVSCGTTQSEETTPSASFSSTKSTTDAVTVTVTLNYSTHGDTTGSVYSPSSAPPADHSSTSTDPTLSTTAVGGDGGHETTTSQVPTTREVNMLFAHLDKNHVESTQTPESSSMDTTSSLEHTSVPSSTPDQSEDVSHSMETTEPPSSPVTTTPKSLRTTSASVTTSESSAAASTTSDTVTTTSTAKATLAASTEAPSTQTGETTKTTTTTKTTNVTTDPTTNIFSTSSSGSGSHDVVREDHSDHPSTISSTHLTIAGVTVGVMGAVLILPIIAVIHKTLKSSWKKRVCLNKDAKLTDWLKVRRFTVNDVKTSLAGIPANGDIWLEMNKDSSIVL